MSRRRGHCPGRGRGERGGGGAGGPGWLGRGSGCGEGALEREKSTWPRAPCPPFPAPGEDRVPGPPGAGGQRREPGRGRGKGRGRAVAPTPAPAPGLAALRPGKFSPSSGLRALRAPSPIPVPRPARPAPGVGGRFCARGPRPGGPIMTFPELQTGVDGERAPDCWFPPNPESLIPAPRAPSPGLLGLFIANPHHSWTPVAQASGACPILSPCPPGTGMQPPGSCAPCPCSGQWLPGAPNSVPDSRVLALCLALPPPPRPARPPGPGPSPAAPGPASSSNRDSARRDGSGGSRGDIGRRRRRGPRAPGPMAAGRDPPSRLLPPSLGSGRVPGQPPRRQLRRSETAGPPRPQPSAACPAPGPALRSALPPGLPGSLPTLRPHGRGPADPRKLRPALQ